MKITKLPKLKSEIFCPTKGLTEISTNYQPKILYNLLIKNPQLVNSKDQKNETILSYALKRKNEENCELIIASPILNLFYQDSEGNSYLHLSVINQLISITELLIKKGININSKNNEGNTALHYAYNLNNKKLISVLIENNADTNIKNNNGLIPEQMIVNSLNTDLNSKFDDFFNKNYYNNYLDKNSSIRMNNYENNNITFNNTNNTKLNETNKISFQNSLVNFSYSDDNDDIKKINTSDIFEITQSSMYKDKIKDVSNKNSHTIGDRYNILPDNKDININNKKNNINNSKNDIAIFEYSTSISKEEKDQQIQKYKLSNNINNYDNKNNKINVNDEDNINNINLYNNSLKNNKFFESKILLPPDINKDSQKYQINNFMNNNSKDISNDSLRAFLQEINLEQKYYYLMNSNGFEDIQLLIDQEKNSSLNTSITDSELKEIGIFLPGDRAKILIHLEEQAGNFPFSIPKEVYYHPVNLIDFMEDNNIQKIYNWLKMIKVENYLKNFLEGGYYSIELILMQMNSKNPITNLIINDELGIKKVGHRARIINKLAEDGKKFLLKRKEKVIKIGNGQTDKNCDCIIF